MLEKRLTQQDNMIKIVLTIGDKKQTTRGSTLKKAVDRLKTPDIITARGNLRVYKDSKFIYQFPMTLPRLRRLFSVKFSFKNIMIKKFELFLK